MFLSRSLFAGRKLPRHASTGSCLSVTLVAAMCAGVAMASPDGLGEQGVVAAQQESNPFAPKPPKARELPSILERDAQGRVIWIEGDPAHRALDEMNLPSSVRTEVDRLLTERDRQMLQAALPNTDKIVSLLEAWREGTQAEFDVFGQFLLSSMGGFVRRATIHNDPQIRAALTRPQRNDLNTIVREYNLARVAEARQRIEAEAAARGEELPEILLRDSTILQRFIQRDVIADVTVMLHESFGGDDAFVSAHPELAGVVAEDGYWVAMGRLTDAQLTAFVRDRTGLEVRFPSPEGQAALSPSAGQTLEPAERGDGSGGGPGEGPGGQG